MRILIHTDDFPPTVLAGSYRMEVMAEELAGMGHDVLVITGTKNRGDKPLGEKPYRIRYAPTSRMTKKTTLIRMLSNLSFAVTSVIWSVGTGKADVVITTSPPPLVSVSAWLIAKMKGAKLVYDVRDIWPDVALEMNSFSENSFYCRVFDWIAKFMYCHADLITAVTPRKVIKLQEKVPAGRNTEVVLVSNGYDTRNDAKVLDPNVGAGYDMDKRFTTVYIGNVGMAQGLESMLEIARRTKHRDAQFLIFGNGARKDALAEQIRREDLTNVRVCGVLPNEQVFSILHAAKISYIPLKSSKMRDSVPTKLYEALGLGCPVLLAAVGDASDILEECGLGCSAAPEDTDAIVAKFDEMVDRYDEILCCREKAMELIRKKHSRQSAVKELEKKLRELVKE